MGIGDLAINLSGKHITILAVPWSDSGSCSVECGGYDPHIKVLEGWGSSRCSVCRNGQTLMSSGMNDIRKKLDQRKGL